MNQLEQCLEKIDQEITWLWRRNYDLRLQIQKELITDPVIYYYMTWLIDRYHDRMIQLDNEVDQLISGGR